MANETLPWWVPPLPQLGTTGSLLFASHKMGNDDMVLASSFWTFINFSTFIPWTYMGHLLLGLTEIEISKLIFA